MDTGKVVHTHGDCDLLLHYLLFLTFSYPRALLTVVRYFASQCILLISTMIHIVPVEFDRLIKCPSTSNRHPGLVKLLPNNNDNKEDEDPDDSVCYSALLVHSRSR